MSDRLFDVAAEPRPVEEGTNRFRRLGTAAELRLAAELLERDFEVAWPVVDEGYDLIVDRVLRIQVKSSSQRAKNGSLVLNCGSHRLPHKRIKNSIDVLAVFDRDTTDWWFVPANFYTVPTVVLDIRLCHWRNCWHLLTQWIEAERRPSTTKEER